MRISQGLGKPTPLDVTFPHGDILHVVYMPSSFTPAELAEMVKRDGKDIGQVVESIRRLIVEWDLTDEEDVPIPIAAPIQAENLTTDPETGERAAQEKPVDPLWHVPVSIYMTIIKAVNEDQNPGEVSRN